MSKAAELAALIGSQTALSHRNLIINGAMQVAQLGTSSTAGGYCSLDRFFINLSGASATFSQETVTLGDSVVGDFINYARLNVTTGNNFCMIRQRIEDVQSVQEGTATLSFYAKGTNPGGGVCTVQASQRFGTSGSSDVDISGQTFTLTSNWQRFDFQFTIPSISGKTIGTGGTSFQFDIGQGSDTSTNAWQIDITGVQLEVGEQATPFEHRSFGDELAKCQRYYQKSYDYGTAIGASTEIGAIFSRIGTAVSNQPIQVVFPVPMRGEPTDKIYSLVGTVGSVSDCGTSYSHDHDEGASINGTIGQTGFSKMQGVSMTAGNMYAFHYTMDAEL